MSREWGGRLFSWLHSRYHSLASARDPPSQGVSQNDPPSGCPAHAALLLGTPLPRGGVCCFSSPWGACRVLTLAALTCAEAGTGAFYSFRCLWEGCLPQASSAASFPLGPGSKLLEAWALGPAWVRG